MASDRKANYVFYERKVRDDKEIESLLLEDGENEESEENDEWVVQKSAKKLASTPNLKNGKLSGNISSRQSPSLKSPRKAVDNEIVSPIKIKRKLSYAVNKVKSPLKKRPDIVSPILIKRIPDSDTVTVYSPSACHRKFQPTIELTSSDDDEDPEKLKLKNKKRPKTSCSSDDSDSETRIIKTSPKKRITYFEVSEDDEFELHKSKPKRQMPSRKSKPLKLKLSGSEDEEPNSKKTPSRKCKVQQVKGEAALVINGSVTPSKTLRPSKSLTNGTPKTPTGDLSTRISSRKRSANASVEDKSRLSEIGVSRVLNALVCIERMDFSPSKCVGSRTPLKSLANGTPKKPKGDSPVHISSRKGSANFATSLVDDSRRNEKGMARVLNALESIESLGLSPPKGSVNMSKVNSPKSKGKGVSSSTDTPSKQLPNSPVKSSGSRRTSRRNLEDVFVDELKDAESDAESNPSSTENLSPSNAPRARSGRRGGPVTKTPSKISSSGEVGNSASTTTAKTPSKTQVLQSADALSKADATPEKGFTPGKSIAKSTRATPAKGTTPSKATTPAKPSSVVIPVSSSEEEEEEEEEEELATPLRRGYKRAAKSKPCSSPKVDVSLRRSARTHLKAVTPVRRSARVSMSPSTPSLRQKVLLANTPRSSLPPLKDESESEEEFVTPRKTPVTAKKKLDMTPPTPLSCRKVGHGFLSPVVPERERRGLSTPSTDLGIARTQLQVSTLPRSLPCREREFSDIKNFIIRKLTDGTGGCMYISGCPGTGKTATVHTVVRALQKLAEDRETSAFDFVEVNGLRLTEPRQAYVRIWHGLSKNKVTPDQALKHLETKFSGKPKRSTVLLVDELDYLCNRRQDVIYNILDWTTKRYSKLVVLTIANTMDLPERTLKGKITSRMGLTRLGFQSYNFHQLEEIVLNRLDGCKAFNRDAVQLVARKVAAVSGDARRALDICRRSTEILELEGRTNVSVLDIQRVLTQIFAGSRVQAVKNCSAMAKLVLRAIKDEVCRTGVEETTIAFIHPQLVSICALEGKREPTVTDLLAICSNLAESGLIFAEKGRKDINRKISLNVSGDDIHYAINC